MIAFQVSLSVLTSCLTLLNLLLILGIARRTRRNPGAAAAPAGGIKLSYQPGTDIGDFTVTSTEGATVSRDGLEIGTVFAFLSPTCEPCREALPDLIAYGTARKGAVVSVLTGDFTADDLASLEALGPVVDEGPKGPVAKAFGVVGVPVFVTVGGGQVLSASGEVGELWNSPA